MKGEKMGEELKEVSSSRVDPERQKALEEFRQIEGKVFITPEDQGVAK